MKANIGTLVYWHGNEILVQVLVCAGETEEEVDFRAHEVAKFMDRGDKFSNKAQYLPHATKKFYPSKALEAQLESLNNWNKKYGA